MVVFAIGQEGHNILLPLNLLLLFFLNNLSMPPFSLPRFDLSLKIVLFSKRIQHAHFVPWFGLLLHQLLVTLDADLNFVKLFIGVH